jgi:membrane protease YdiL (CAAX protease family)
MEQSATLDLNARHSAPLSIALHLLPGLLTGAAYYLLAGPVARLGLPSVAALMLAGLLGILPFELGVIALAARRRGVRFFDLIAYRDRLPGWSFVLWTAGLFVATGLVFTLLTPLTQFLLAQFRWLPESMLLNLGLDGNTARTTLIGVTALNALLGVIVLPVTEELYFRGFLLPRMPAGLKGLAPLAHSLLFALYHFWSPWMLVTRTLGLLPTLYVVRHTRNLYVGMVVHCLVNFLDVVTMIAVIARLS